MGKKGCIKGKASRSRYNSDVLKKPDCGRCAELRDVLESYAGDVDVHKEPACLDCTERRAQVQRSVPCTPGEDCNCELFMCDCGGEDDPQLPPSSPPSETRKPFTAAPNSQQRSDPTTSLPHYRTGKVRTSSPVTPEARWDGSPILSSDEDISFM
jgi:hypothetical protein